MATAIGIFTVATGPGDGAQVHHLPCDIAYDGPAPVRAFFVPRAAPADATGQAAPPGRLAAAFRGRAMEGQAVPLPAGVVGAVLREGRVPYSHAAAATGRPACASVAPVVADAHAEDGDDDDEGGGAAGFLVLSDDDDDEGSESDVGTAGATRAGAAPQAASGTTADDDDDDDLLALVRKGPTAAAATAAPAMLPRTGSAAVAAAAGVTSPAATSLAASSAAASGLDSISQSLGAPPCTRALHATATFTTVTNWCVWQLLRCDECASSQPAHQRAVPRDSPSPPQGI